jgi:hypothetical protein
VSKNNVRAALVIGVVVGVALLLWAAMPRKDFCADSIRGFKARANASFGVIRTGYESLKGALGTESSMAVPQLENLDALDFTALRACEVNCGILSSCLRFVFFRPPSQACPREYDELLQAQRRAEALLERLAVMERQTKAAGADISKLEEARAEVDQLEKAGAATGTRLARAEERQHQVEADIAARLLRVSSDLADLQGGASL